MAAVFPDGGERLVVGGSPPTETDPLQTFVTP
jgi:hypothetical protein